MYKIKEELSPLSPVQYKYKRLHLTGRHKCCTIQGNMSGQIKNYLCYDFILLIAPVLKPSLPKSLHFISSEVAPAESDEYLIGHQQIASHCLILFSAPVVEDLGAERGVQLDEGWSELL